MDIHFPPRSGPLPERSGQGAAVGVGMLRGAGLFLTWKFKKHLRFTKFRFHVFNRYWQHIQDIRDFIRRIFITCRCLSSPESIKYEASNKMRFLKKIITNIYIYICIYLYKYSNGFLDLFKCPGVSKDKNDWFWGVGIVSKSWNHRNRIIEAESF